MKHAILSTLAIVLVAARTAVADTRYLSWTFDDKTDAFSDLGSYRGDNYQACSRNSVAVGLTANGSNIQTISLTCGTLVPSNASSPVIIDRRGVPMEYMSYAIKNSGRWLGGDNGPRNTCPDGQMVVGASCTGNDCTNMGIYCAPVYPDASGRTVRTAQMTPDDADPISFLTRAKCGWSNIINSGESGECPKFKVLAGLQCWGKRCSHLTLYCCPVLEES